MKISGACEFSNACTSLQMNRRQNKDLRVVLQQSEVMRETWVMTP